VPAEVALAGTRQIDVVSPAGHLYRIFVAVPDAPAPPQGFPALLLLDGNACFATAVEAMRLQSVRPAVTGVEPAVVVGIGYPTDCVFDHIRRSFDYTPSPPPRDLPPRPDGSAWPSCGGGDAFLAFLADKVIPMLVRDFGADPDRLGLFGHSFGGLFVLHALFAQPGLFRGYVAASPSVWWEAERLLEEPDRLRASLGAAAARLRVMVTIGGREQDVPAAADPDGFDRRQWVGIHRMVDNAREMGHRLAPLASIGVRTAFVEFPDENHVSVVPAAVSRALRFVLEP
jgi:predicted alpha/beta superfamily hydrolase